MGQDGILRADGIGANWPIDNRPVRLPTVAKLPHKQIGPTTGLGDWDEKAGLPFSVGGEPKEPVTLQP